MNDAGKIDGYNVYLCMFDKDKPTPDQKSLVKVIVQIGEKCKEFIRDNNDKISRHNLDRAELRNILSHLYSKNEEIIKGERIILRKVKGKGPILYAKLSCTKNRVQIWSNFFDVEDLTSLSDEGRQINARDLGGVYMIPDRVSFRYDFIPVPY